MPRCPKRRLCRDLEGSRVYKPAAVPLADLQKTNLGLDELEAMRLCDVEGLDQRAAGMRMGVSRGTVQRLLARGRTKLVSAVVDHRALVVEPHAAAALDACTEDGSEHLHKETL